MKLAHKNFYYTAIVTALLTVLVMGYFVCMLPSLYVDYISDENYNAIVAQHKAYLKDGSYQNITVKTQSCFSVDVPFADDTIQVTGKNFQAKITPKTSEMKGLLTDIKNYAKDSINQVKHANGTLDKKSFDKKIKQWEKVLKTQIHVTDDLPFELKSNFKKDTSDYYTDKSTTVHYISKHTVVLESSVSDGDNHYTSYLALTYTKKHIVISFLSTMTPQMNEITPIILRSLPMLVAVIVLFALVVSSLYSRGMVAPIERLVRHTQMIKESRHMGNISLSYQGKDEIAQLIQTLNELYEEIQKNYDSLENVNAQLKEKNTSQEIFLRSSSHQLKTPIAAALLLTDGMINQIGKYKEVSVYLPEVKKQLLSMKKMVEDILYLNRSKENLNFEMINVNTLLENQIHLYQVPLLEGEFVLELDVKEEWILNADANVFQKILDNLISNAIVHSKRGANIRITILKNELRIKNSGAHIKEEILSEIFEPFVSSGNGHGLGLYIVSYYAKLLGLKIEVCNELDGVCMKLTYL